MAGAVLVLWVVALALLFGGHRRWGSALKRTSVVFLIVALVAVAVMPIMTNSAYGIMQGIDYVFWLGGSVGIGLLGALATFPIFVMSQVQRTA